MVVGLVMGFVHCVKLLLEEQMRMSVVVYCNLVNCA